MTPTTQTYVMSCELLAESYRELAATVTNEHERDYVLTRLALNRPDHVKQLADARGWVRKFTGAAWTGAIIVGVSAGLEWSTIGDGSWSGWFVFWIYAVNGFFAGINALRMDYFAQESKENVKAVQGIIDALDATTLALAQGREQ